jgi:hypothetical protein
METLCAHTSACSSRIHTKGWLTSSTIAITPTTLRVRLLLAVGADPDRVWQAVRAEIARLLADHRLDHVTVLGLSGRGYAELRLYGVLRSLSIRCSPRLALGLAWWHHACGGNETRFS